MSKLHGTTSVNLVGGVSEFHTINNGPFRNVTPGGVPLKRKLKSEQTKLRIERHLNELYIEINLSASYEKTHDHMRNTVVLNAEQIELLKQIIDGTKR